MDDDLSTLQKSTIAHVVKRLFKSEKIVNYDLDLSKWKIKHLYKDTIWVKLLDEPRADTVIRNGIAIPVSQTKGLYRLGEVIMCGIDTKCATVGEIVRFPQGVGQPYEQDVDGYRTWLLREESVMAVVEFDGPSSDIAQSIEDSATSYLDK